MAGPESYAGVASMAHAMRSRMLSQSDYDRILRAEKLQDTLAALRETAYATLIQEQESADSALEGGLFEMLLNDIHALQSMAPHESKKLLSALSLRIEMHFIKLIVRAAFSGQALDDFPMPTGFGIGRDVALDIARSGNLTRIAELIPDEMVRRELLTISSSRDPLGLLVAETSIDRAVAARLWQSSLFLGALDRQLAKRIVTLQLDLTNTMALLRSRMLGLKDELEEKLLIPVPSSNWPIVAKARASRTLQEAVRVVATGPYGLQIERATSGRKDEEAISAIELEFRRHIVGVCKTAFSGAPFNAGLILGFVLLREFEIGDLVAIVTGRKAGMSKERLKELLVVAA